MEEAAEFSRILSSGSPTNLEEAFGLLAARQGPMVFVQNMWDKSQLRKHRNFFLSVVDLKSPYSKNFNCVLFSLLQLKGLVDEDPEVRLLLKNYLSSKILRQQDVEDRLEILLVLEEPLQSMISDYPVIREVFFESLEDIGKDQIWETKLAPYVSGWVEQRSQPR